MKDASLWAIATGAAIVLTPLLMQILSRWFPPRSRHAADFDTLRSRYRTIDGWSQLIAIIGMAGALAFMLWLRVGNTPWLIGVAFGWSVLAPVIFIAACTLPRGLFCWFEFWCYYELRYRLSLGFIAPFLTALCALGAVSTVIILSRQ